MTNTPGTGSRWRRRVGRLVCVLVVAALLPAVEPVVVVPEALAQSGPEPKSTVVLCEDKEFSPGHWRPGGEFDVDVDPLGIGNGAAAQVWVPPGATVQLWAKGTLRVPSGGNGTFRWGVREPGSSTWLSGLGSASIATLVNSGTTTRSWTRPSGQPAGPIEVVGYVNTVSGTPPAQEVVYTLRVTVVGGDGTDGDDCEDLREKRGGNFGEGGPNSSVEDPVNTATGNFFDSAVDIAAPGVSAMAWERTYNSQDDGGPTSAGLGVPAVLGAGWTTMVDARLVEIGDHLEFRGPDGVRHRLAASGGGWVASERFPVSVTELGGAGGFELEWPGEGVWAFDGAGLVTRFDDGFGRSIRVSRTGGVATGVQAFTGESGSYAFSLVDDVELDGTAGSDGRLDRVQGPGGVRVDYDYYDDEVADGAAFGRLESVSRPYYVGGAPAGSVTYSYDETSGLLTEVVESVGGGLSDVVRVANTYDWLDRVATQTMASGSVAVFDYGPSWQSTETTVSWAEGTGPDQSLVYAHDENGWLLGVTDPDGNDAAWVWEPSGQLAGSEDRALAVSAAGYDAGLRPTTIEAPHPTTTGTSVVDSEVEYCDASADDPRVLSATDAAGSVTEFTYGESTDTGFPCPPGVEVPSSMTVGAGTAVEATTLLESVDGLVTEVTDPDGVVVVNEWDTTNQLLLSTTTDPDTASAGVLTTYFGYDDMGRLEVTRTPEGIESWTVHNADGTVASEVGPVAVARTCDGTTCDWTSVPSGPTVSYTYWGDGRRKTRTDELGKVWSEQRDYLSGGGWTDTWTEPDGDIRVETYDEAQNLITETVGDPADLAGDELAVTTHAYGILGRRASTTSPEGVVTHFRYDDEGRLVETTTGTDDDDPAHTWTTSYDLRGRVTAELGPTGDVDENSDPVRHSTTYVYDDADRVIETTVGTGGDALRTSTVYDPLGRVRFEITDLDGDNAPNDPVASDPADRDPGDLVVEYTYTAAGRPDEVIRPPADAASFDWVTGTAKRVTSYGYDDAGRRTSVTRPDTETTELTLDGDGRLERRDDPNGWYEAYAYNPRGQAVTVTTPHPTGGTGTVVATATYDDRGDLTSETEPHDPGVSSPPATGFVYYDDGSLWKARDARYNTIGALAEVVYTYDGRGNRRTRTAWAANDGANPTSTHQTVEEWRYDLDDRLVEHERPLGGITVTAYDGYGRVSTVTRPSGRVETREWWNSGPVRTHTFTQPGEDPVEVERFFDSRGRRTEMTDPVGVSTRSYDPAGRITSLTVPAQGAAATYDFAYDLSGNTIQRDTATGATFTYTHTVLDQLDTVAAEIGASSWPIADHTYDTGGNLIDVQLIGGAVGSRSWTYPANGSAHPSVYEQELLTAGTETWTTTMDWYDQGRLAQETSEGCDRTYDYDPAGQLLGRSDDCEPDIAYTYGPRGERHTQTVTDGVTSTVTTYSYDDDTRLTGSQTVAGPTRAYGYDPDGRRTLTTQDSVETQLLTYEPRGLLEGVRNGDNTAPTEARAYDGDGRLVGYDAPGADLDIVWDPTEAIDQISDVRVGATGAVLIARASQVVSFGYFEGGTQLGGGVYSYDAHGSYIDNTNWPAPTGYSPYGHPEDLPAGSPVQGAYRGEMTISGLLHLRNRDYDPTTGTFTTPDPLDGQDATPTVANPYHYTDNDPTNQTDPLGLSPLDLLDRLDYPLFGPNCTGWAEIACQLARTVLPGNRPLVTVIGRFCWAHPIACALIGVGFYLATQVLPDLVDKIFGDSPSLPDDQDPPTDDDSDCAGTQVSCDRRTLYHYASDGKLAGILACSCIPPSLASNNQAVAGHGVYLTDISNTEAGTVTAGQLSFALTSTPFGGFNGHFNNFIAVDATLLPSFRRYSNAYGSRFPEKGLYVVNSEIDVPVSILSSGRVPYASN